MTELTLTSGNDEASFTENDLVVYGLGGFNNLQALGDNITLNGGSDNDWLHAIGANATLIGGKGGDLYYVNSTSTVIETDAWDQQAYEIDIVVTSDTTVDLNSSFANIEGVYSSAEQSVLLIGNGYDNPLKGGIGDDELRGGAGNDTLYSTDGHDVLVGNSGDDTYFWDNEDTIVELAGGGIDSVSCGQELVSIENIAHVENLFGAYIYANQTLIGNSLSNVIVSTRPLAGWGQFGAEYVCTIHGRGGDDQIFGEQTRNVMHGESGNDWLAGAVSYDSIFYGIEGLTPPAYLGDDTLDGGAGHDVLFGGFGDDNLSGGTGNDLLDGGEGKNRLEGGAGDDVYIINSLDDTVIELDDGGYDTVYVNPSLLGIMTFANVERVLIATGESVIFGTQFEQTIAGTAASDVLAGGGGNDTIKGAAGADLLFGNQDSDSLYGGQAADRIDGGSGADRLTGGLGKDTLTGGSGADVFDFNAANETGLLSTSRDWITDFQHGIDKIDLRTIDANAGEIGNQAFRFIKSESLGDQAGAIRVWHNTKPAGTTNDYSVIAGDVNGDGLADFRINLKGNPVLSASDFLL